MAEGRLAHQTASGNARKGISFAYGGRCLPKVIQGRFPLCFLCELEKRWDKMGRPQGISPDRLLESALFLLLLFIEVEVR